LGSPTGEQEQATGTATNKMALVQPGKYRVSIETSTSSSDGFYWILETGGIEPGATTYPWAIVSTPGNVQLFVLARDPDIFRAQYKEYVLERLKDMKFIFPYNKPIETVQVPECAYPDEPGVFSFR
jgi:lipocalin